MKLTQEKNENYLSYMNNRRLLPQSHTNLKGECIIVSPISQDVRKYYIADLFGCFKET